MSLKTIFLFLILSSAILSQNNKDGYLGRYHLQTDSLETFEEAPVWSNSYETGAYYLNAFEYQGESYAVRFARYNPRLNFNSATELVELDGGSYHTLSNIPAFIEFMLGGFSPSEIIPQYKENGVWIFHDAFGKIFIDTNNTVHKDFDFQHLLIQIAGRIDSLDAAIIMNKNPYGQEGMGDHHLISGANYPNYEIVDSLIASFEINGNDSENYLKKIQNLKNNLYLYSLYRSDRIMMAKYASSKLKDIKPVLEEYLYKWEFHDNKLIGYNDTSVLRYTFSEMDTTFSFSDTLLAANNFDVGNNIHYASVLSNDTIRVYDLAEDSLIHNVDLTEIDNTWRQFIDYPYVYLHIIDETSDAEKGNRIPAEFKLSQNYPNPFNPETKIKYKISRITNYQFVRVELIVYDILGRKVKTLVNKSQKPGTYEITFNASDLPSGVYFYRLKAGDFVDSRKMILMR
jgi:hypothetical protein